MNSPSNQQDNEALRARFEREQLKKSLRMLQVLAAVQLFVIAGMGYAMFSTTGELGKTTSEVNGLRENIQGLFSENIPLVEELNASMDRANESAAGLETRLEGDFGIEEKMDGAVGRMKREIPKAIESFFDERGGEIMKKSFEDPAVKDQIAATIKESMNDPSVKAAIEDSVKDAFRAGLTKKK